MNQAGIELLLSAPDLKPVLDGIVDSVEELTAAEKENIKAKIELEHQQEALQQRMKEAALENKKIKDSIKELSDQEELAATRRNTGFFQSIKNYFEERRQLKLLGTEIKAVRSELIALEQRQERIFALAHRGNTA